MSKMSLDDLLVEFLNHENGTPYSVPEEELQEATLELIADVLEVGKVVLSKMSREKLAALFSLIQTAILTTALSQGNLKVALMATTEEFSDVLMFAVQATAGILTMEEVR